MAVPELKTRVTDLSQTLTATEIAQLETKLAQLEQAKGSQIAILIVPSTEPETIEQFSLRVVEQWQLGREKIDDGVLLLVAKNDRKVRIEVGYGLEGAIPDAMANRVIDEYVVPAFKAGDFFGGIDQAMQKLIGLIQGEPLPEPNQSDQPSWLPFIFIIVLVAAPLMNALFGRLLGSTAAGGMSGVVAWLTMHSVLIGVGIGFFIFIASIVLGMLSSNYVSGRGNRYDGGGFSGDSSGDSGGSSSSDSGFSGGGGDFGGGGASGEW